MHREAGISSPGRTGGSNHGWTKAPVVTDYRGFVPTLRPARAQLGQWLRLATMLVLLLLFLLGVKSDPLPSWPLAAAVVIAAMAGVVSTTVGLLPSRPRRGRRGDALLTVQFTILIVSSALLAWLEPNGAGFVGGFVAASAAARLPRRAGLAVTACTMAVLALASLLGAHRPLVQVVISELGVVAFYRVGDYASRLRARSEEAEGLLAELRETRAAQVQAATLAERQRLAREMHDVLAHSLSGLVLHLEGARMLATHESVTPRLADAIRRAHHLAETGLGEARQAIGMLRDDDLPGPELLPALVAGFEHDTGVTCRFTISGSPVELASQIRLTVYRVAQESLTNIRKHAHPDAVSLSLCYAPTGISLTVEDIDSSVRDSAPDDHGYGITGMRERAELLGGTLNASVTETGFLVKLWLPR